MELGLIIQNDKVVVSSRKVAEVYDKRHDHVLDGIRSILKQVPEALPNFRESSYINEQNREMPEYLMDRQGFSMLVMGFTGEQARRFTYQYTLAFEQMANKLTLKLPSSYKEALLALVEAEERKEQLQLANKTLDTENKLLAQENLAWADRKIIDAAVKKLGANIGFSDAWREFKKELLYKHGINLNSRITNYMNASGRKTAPQTLSMIHDEELQACVSTAVALCRHHKLDISNILEKFSKTA